jgi:hypothetical protein
MVYWTVGAAVRRRVRRIRIPRLFQLSWTAVSWRGPSGPPTVPKEHATAAQRLWGDKRHRVFVSAASAAVAHHRRAAVRRQVIPVSLRGRAQARRCGGPATPGIMQPVLIGLRPPVALAVLVACLVAGCGSQAQSGTAAQTLTSVIARVRATSAWHVHAAPADGTLQVDADYTGSDYRITYTNHTDGLVTDDIVVGGVHYARSTDTRYGSPNLWRQLDAVRTNSAGVSPSEVASCLEQHQGTLAIASTSSSSSFVGQAALELTSLRAGPGQSTFVLYISAADSKTLLAIDTPAGGPNVTDLGTCEFGSAAPTLDLGARSFRYEFSQYGAVPTITSPPG